MQQITLLIIGIAGFVFQSLCRLRSLSNDAFVANMKFNWIEDYVKKDIYGILAAAMSPFIWLYLFGEITAKYPALEGFTKTSFFIMGAMGSWALQLMLGGAKKAIRKVVDEKTNIADGKTEQP